MGMGWYDGAYEGLSALCAVVPNCRLDTGVYAMAIGKEGMYWKVVAVCATAVAIGLWLMLHGWGCAPPITPEQITDITIYDPNASEYPEPGDASKASVIPHADLGPERTRRILDGAECRTFLPLLKCPLPGIAKVRGGGERDLSLPYAPLGWIKVWGQWGGYNLTPKSGEELLRLMKVCQTRCFDRAEDRAERTTKDDGPHPMRIDGKYGYVAESGTVVIPPQFDDAMPFSEGLAAVRVGDAQGGRWGYIKRDGTFAIQPRFSGASFFSDGLAVITVDDYFDGKQGYVDRNGKVVIEAQFEDAFEFRHGFADVRFRGTWQHIDHSGRAVTYISASEYDLKEGVEIIQVDGKYGFWGGGFFLMPPEFEDARMFSEDLAAVKKGGKWGYVNKAGEMVVEPRFDRAWSFSGGKARVEVGSRTLLIDTRGNEVLPEIQNGSQ